MITRPASSPCILHTSYESRHCGSRRRANLAASKSRARHGLPGACLCDIVPPVSRVELAVERVKRLNENQAEALLEWLELRENRDALRHHLDAEIDVGLEQLRRGEKIPAEQVHAEIRERSRRRRSEGDG